MFMSNVINANTNYNRVLNNKINANVASKNKETEATKDAEKDGYAKKITIAKQGQAGYMRSMDLDEDGVLTLEEFNKYCKENSISDSAKQRMLLMMNTANTSGETIKQMEEKSEEAKEKAEEAEEAKDEENADEVKGSKPVKDETSIFAKKGDAQYDEAMDTNSDNKITYKEYAEYCENRFKQQTQPSAQSSETSEIPQKVVNAYKSEPVEQQEEFFFEEVA